MAWPFRVLPGSMRCSRGQLAVSLSCICAEGRLWESQQGLEPQEREGAWEAAAAGICWALSVLGEAAADRNKPLLIRSTTSCHSASEISTPTTQACCWQIQSLNYTWEGWERCKLLTYMPLSPRFSDKLFFREKKSSVVLTSRMFCLRNAFSTIRLFLFLKLSWEVQHVWTFVDDLVMQWRSVSLPCICLWRQSLSIPFLFRHWVAEFEIIRNFNLLLSFPAVLISVEIT